MQKEKNELKRPNACKKAIPREQDNEKHVRLIPSISFFIAVATRCSSPSCIPL